MIIHEKECIIEIMHYEPSIKRKRKCFRDLAYQKGYINIIEIQ